ncbi:MAG: hypothetical protein KIT25_12155 [Enhydrobacter sp.]|nr:MAG: hypothetical protein KIT25_12155 [Enhydrobacter sp.]
MSEAFAAVAEQDATGGTAELFADIRATIGVRVVNLVWRHLATIDGALPWAWRALRPLYVAGIPDEAARQFRKTMLLPALTGLAGDDPASVDDVVASYDHSNTMNLLALGALVAWLRREITPGHAPERGPRLPAPDVALPKLASQSDVSPETWALVLRLNRFGDRPRPLILASMYRHLAHAPQFLARLEPALAAAEADGSLGRSIGDNRRAAREQAVMLARAIVADRPSTDGQIEASISAFLDHAIGKMVTICRAIRAARGDV